MIMQMKEKRINEKSYSIHGRAIILSGLEIDDNAIIGVGVLVAKSVPANTLVYENTVKVFRITYRERK